MLDKNTLNELGQVRLCDIDRDSLVDINDVHIDTSLPPAERLHSYLEQVENPYCFRCGDTPVRVNFAQGGNDLSEILKRYFMGLKTG